MVDRWIGTETSHEMAVVVAHVHVDRREHVIHQHNVGVAVDRAGQGNARLLPARDVDALLSDLGLVARGENLQVRQHRTGFDRGVVALRVQRQAEGDIVSHLTTAATILSDARSHLFKWLARDRP
eukprot:COSAG04_NODE_1192_length_7801_cov_7.001298_6_plen_125_part_00